ncbi:MAG: DUF4907 domain-containing protein [Bacteroidia bacterium]
MKKKIFNYSKLIPACALLLSIGCNNNKTGNERGYSTEDSLKQIEKKIEELKADTSKPKENPYKNAQLDIKVFSNDTIKNSQEKGFGYDIYMYRSLYVHQPNIPAISGNRGFDTEAQARKTAEFIVYKIKNNIMPPAVSPQELDSLGVLQ